MAAALGIRPIGVGSLLCGEPFCGSGEFATEFKVGRRRTSRASGRPTLEPFTQDQYLFKNVEVARGVIGQVLADFAAQCQDEQDQCKQQGQRVTSQRRARWDLYLDKERLQMCAANLTEFVRDHPESRARLLTPQQVRFLVVLQHLLAEDAADVGRPDTARRHGDTFEGVLTEAGVNSQLVKDAHRSEWSIEGRSFTMQEGVVDSSQDRRHVIKAFQQELVAELETFLLQFCKQHELSEKGTEAFMQVVTTQMSQCGLANLDRSSQAAKYFVSGQGLEQRTAYNISSMDIGDSGEALKLSLYCMKTGFTQYHTEETLKMLSNPETAEDCDAGPTVCEPSSILYQYATLRFLPYIGADNCEQIEVLVIDALDEVHLKHPEDTS